jgi:hypothetical protein
MNIMKVVLRMDDLIKEHHCCKVTWMEPMKPFSKREEGGGGIMLDQKIKIYLFIY